MLDSVGCPAWSTSKLCSLQAARPSQQLQPGSPPCWAGVFSAAAVAQAAGSMDMEIVAAGSMDMEIVAVWDPTRCTEEALEEYLWLCPGLALALAWCWELPVWSIGVAF